MNSSSRRNIVIAGGGYAGVSAALRLARQRVDGARIVLVNERREFVERIRLHQRVAGQDVGMHSLAALVRGTPVELRIGAVEALDTRRQALTVDGDELPWDELIVALGSRIDNSRVPGVAEHAVVFEPGTADGIHRHLVELSKSGGSVLIAGGGLTGTELAAEIAESFPSIQVVLAARGVVGGEVSDRGRQHMLSVLRSLGVVVHEDVSIESLREGVAITSSGEWPFDMCVWTAGFAAHSLPGAAGLLADASGRIVVDEYLQSVSHPGIRAAGDIAVLADSEASIPAGCKSALPFGAQAAENLAAQMRNEPPASFSFRTPFYCVSLGRRDGLIQMCDSSGAPREQIMTGQSAAYFKEFICRSTLWSLGLERTGMPGILWLKSEARRRSDMDVQGRHSPLSKPLPQGEGG
jgi:NADH dehydrogenase